MKRILSLLAISLLIPATCFAEGSLIGTYKLVSFLLEIDGIPGQGTIGADPRGYLVITPQHFTFTYTGAGRKFGTSIEDKAALYDTSASLAGRYTVDGSKLTVLVDVSWNELWNGTRQVRSIDWSGNRLTLTSPPQPHPRDPSKTVVSRLVWEKVE
jgi:hypothetical protein